MYLQRIAIGVVAASLVAGSTGALAAQSSAANKPLGKMTCEDFIALDEQFKPKMIYWAQHRRNGEDDCRSWRGVQ